jgi:hypothetical protein
MNIYCLLINIYQYTSQVGKLVFLTHIKHVDITFVMNIVNKFIHNI